MRSEHLLHTIPPVFDARSRVLLLGSFPSPKSREVGFFYGHPQNRMWRVLAAVLGEDGAGVAASSAAGATAAVGRGDAEPAGGSAGASALAATGSSAVAVPRTIEERRAFLLRNRIAMWDVIASCSIEGASDASIRDVVPNDLSRVLDAAPIQAIFCTGSKAHQLYRRYQEPVTGVPARKLPSTSAANASWSLERLVEAYRVVAQAART